MQVYILIFGVLGIAAAAALTFSKDLRTGTGKALSGLGKVGEVIGTGLSSISSGTQTASDFIASQVSALDKTTGFIVMMHPVTEKNIKDLSSQFAQFHILPPEKWKTVYQYMNNAINNTYFEKNSTALELEKEYGIILGPTGLTDTGLSILTHLYNMGTITGNIKRIEKNFKI